MRRGLKTGFLVGMLIGLLTGCGGEYAGVSDQGAASGSAVSGGAVSGQGVQVNRKYEKQTMFPDFCTDTDWYQERYLEPGIVQSRLDGSDARVILEDRASWIVSVVDAWLYYVNYDEETSRECICRVPVEKDKSGNDRVLEEQEEKLVTGQGVGSIYVNSQFILYSIYGNGKLQFMRYDLETGEKTDAGEILLNDPDPDWEADIIGSGDHVFAMSFLDGVFLWEAEGKKWTKISDYDAVWEEGAWNDLYYFFSDGEKQKDEVDEIPNCIYRYALKNGTKEQIVSPEQLLKSAQEAQGLPDAERIDACVVTDLFCQGERLYFQVQLNWNEGKEYYMAYLMFSQDQKDSFIRYEKNLTECMRNHGTWRNGRWETKVSPEQEDGIWDYKVTENIVCNEGRCYDMINGRAYMMYCDEYGFSSEKMWADRIGCYDLMTGEFRWLTEKDPEYFEPAYKCRGETEYFNSWKSYTHVNNMIGTGMEWGPKTVDGLSRRSAFGGFRERETSDSDGSD